MVSRLTDERSCSAAAPGCVVGGYEERLKVFEAWDFSRQGGPQAMTKAHELAMEKAWKRANGDGDPYTCMYCRPPSVSAPRRQLPLPGANLQSLRAGKASRDRAADVYAKSRDDDSTSDYLRTSANIKLGAK